MERGKRGCAPRAKRRARLAIGGGCMLPVEAIPRHKREGGNAERQRAPLFSPYIRHRTWQAVVGRGNMGKKGSGEEREEKGPLPTQYGGMHTTFSPSS